MNMQTEFEYRNEHIRDPNVKIDILKTWLYQLEARVGRLEEERKERKMWWRIIGIMVVVMLIGFILYVGALTGFGGHQ